MFVSLLIPAFEFCLLATGDVAGPLHVEDLTHPRKNPQIASIQGAKI